VFDHLCADLGALAIAQCLQGAQPLEGVDQPRARPVGQDDYHRLRIVARKGLVDHRLRLFPELPHLVIVFRHQPEDIGAMAIQRLASRANAHGRHRLAQPFGAKPLGRQQVLAGCPIAGVAPIYINRAFAKGAFGQ